MPVNGRARLPTQRWSAPQIGSAVQSTTRPMIDLLDLWPGPGVVPWKVPASHLPLDCRGIENETVTVAASDAAQPPRTTAADDADRVHPVRAEPEGPEQTRRGDLPVDLGIVAAVLDLQRVVRRSSEVVLQK